MSRSHKAKVARRDARHGIVAAAERHRANLGLGGKPYSMRRLNEAVCVVRRNKLLPAKTLIAAGFNATGR